MTLGLILAGVGLVAVLVWRGTRKPSSGPTGLAGRRAAAGDGASGGHGGRLERRPG